MVSASIEGGRVEVIYFLGCQDVNLQDKYLPVDKGKELLYLGGCLSQRQSP